MGEKAARADDGQLLVELEKVARLFAKARTFGAAFNKHLARVEELVGGLLEDGRGSERSTLSATRPRSDGGLARALGVQAETLLAFARMGERQTVKIIEMAARSSVEKAKAADKLERRLQKKKQKIASLKAKLGLQTALTQKLRAELERGAASPFARLSHFRDVAEVKLRVTPLNGLYGSKGSSPQDSRSLPSPRARARRGSTPRNRRRR